MLFGFLQIKAPSVTEEIVLAFNILAVSLLKQGTGVKGGGKAITYLEDPMQAQVWGHPSGRQGHTH